MKHLLPILTLALLGAAATAFADNFYYGEYRDRTLTDLPDNPNNVNGNTYWNDKVTFNDLNFEIIRNSNWNTSLNSTNFYLIRVLGDNVTLSLTDRFNSAYSNNAALYDNIVEYGYRKMTEVNGMYVVDEAQTYVNGGDHTVNMVSVSNGTPSVTEITKDGDVSKDPTVIDNARNGLANRYQYNLGTFKNGDIIELYMKSKSGEAYSFSGFNEFDEHVGALGGFDDGVRASGSSTDMILYQYYFQDGTMRAAALAENPNLTEEELQKIGFGEDDAARTTASKKAMPLAGLDVLTGAEKRLYFGIYASAAGPGTGTGTDTGSGTGTSGAPLPGGLQIALVAGLFGLGFWYVRRRKTTVA